MEIRTRPIWGSVTVVGGVLQIFTALTDHSIRNAGLVFMLGILGGGVFVALMGMHLLVLAPIYVDEHEVRLRNAGGSTKRRILLRSLADVHIDGREISVTSASGERVKLILSSNRWMFRQDDVSLLEQRVHDAQPRP
jgi:hypothetical protein